MRLLFLSALMAVILWSIATARATVVISEFMASNSGILRDDFDDSPDWIELHNSGDDPVDLQGWALTDRAEDPWKWVLPNRVIEPGGYLVVFASGRDRKLPGAPLHTNFALRAEGE
jgi:hypothetical protein